MRILFLTDNFPPEGNAPATRTYEHAVRWVRAGHEVTVITCAPNFPEGKLFPGYRNAWRSVETLDGIRVVRVKTYITANEGILKRTLDYLSFMAAGTVAGLFERRHDVVVATSPQFFCALGGWALARLKRRPFVFELRDLWPASITAVGAMQRSAAIRALEKLEMFLYRSADAIVPVTQSFREELVHRGVRADKIHVVLNGVDLQRYRPAARDQAMAKQYDLDGRFVVGYLGTHGMAHGLEKVIEAAERLRDDPRIVFFFAGSGAQRAHVERMAAERALPNVRMIPRQPKEMMPRLWGLCDLSLIPLRDTPVFASVIPSKLFEGMGMGIPALMSLPRGEAVRIVESTGCGVCVAPENAAAMADEIAALAGDPERMRRLREASLAAAPAYSRDRQARLMSDALARLVDDDGARGLLRTPE
ncbi:glycosyltransferase family 4 protein [Lysobacter yananisis]|uniref:Glycosyltransferase family 4 protein n=1 Tax=Lysobacter yananisis TaxID=1003114 RepID=A0ABY9P8C0_9GAMM|nr:glycosyltransferase family 4 protein [Lysobacter yananisis]WMT02411.1 glycosyltransferase family 4 protein [Lysobacter yananisis]